tara:strand:- start:1704 stop:1883 length:180 start_codon:yes stop_codon:yes gene_type:complete
MNSFWNQNNYKKLLNISVFLIVVGGILAVIEFLTENSTSILVAGVLLLFVLKILQSKFY